MSEYLSILKSLNALLDPGKESGDIDWSDESLLSYLEIRIQELMNTDFQGLLQTLYILDVNEKELKKNIQNSSPEKVARVIAEMVLVREKQKLNTKEEYRQFRADNNDDDEERW